MDAVNAVPTVARIIAWIVATVVGDNAEDATPIPAAISCSRARISLASGAACGMSSAFPSDCY